MSGRHGVEGLLLHPPQLQQPDVVVAGDEQRIVWGGLQVDGELAVVRHPAVQAAGELEDDGLQTGVLFDVPHFDDLQNKTTQICSVETGGFLIPVRHCVDNPIFVITHISICQHAHRVFGLEPFIYQNGKVKYGKT